MAAGSGQQGADANFVCLRAELARVDILIRCYLQRHQIELNQQLGGIEEYAPQVAALRDPEVIGLLEAPLGMLWSVDAASIADEAFVEQADIYRDADAYADALAQAYMPLARQAHQAVKTAHQTGQTLRLPHLIQTFGLDEFETSVLLIALAAALDRRYARLYARLLDDLTLRHATVELVLDFLCPPGLARMGKLAHFYADAPLRKHHLIELGGDEPSHATPLTGRSIVVPTTLVAWLLGEYHPHPLLSTDLQLHPARDDATDALLAAEAWAQVAPALDHDVVIALTGEDRGAQAAIARRIAHAQDCPLLTADMAGLLARGHDVPQMIRTILRDARLTNAVLYLDAIDAALDEGILAHGLWAELQAHPGRIVTGGRAVWRGDGTGGSGAADARPVWTIALHTPSYAQRQRLWRHFLGDVDAQAVDIDAVTAQFDLSGHEIRSVVASARNAAAQAHYGQQPGTADETPSRLNGTKGEESAPPGGLPTLTDAYIWAAVRQHTNSHLDELAHKITPRYMWDDLVIPDAPMAILREVVAMTRGRHKVLDEWGLGQKLVASAAVTVLFAGEPGTGKTMAAEVLARELGLSLYKIDIAAMVSKYIGETEKNLERIFTEAERSNVILFFDEADAIFGKRSGVKDSHDRYANIGVSYLLQRMEMYSGMTILATNIRANMDEAFIRRLQFVVEFPFPDAAERLRIWQTLLPSKLPLADDVDLSFFADNFKLAGGNIRNAIVSAAYLAADQGNEVTMEHLWHGVRREWQKMGHLAPTVELPKQRKERRTQPNRRATPPADPPPDKFYRIRYK